MKNVSRIALALVPGYSLHDPSKFCVWPEVSGETPLVTTWRYN